MFRNRSYNCTMKRKVSWFMAEQLPLRRKLKKREFLLAPLRFGAGIKGKFTDAMQVGTPTVTTNLGAEGMAGNLPWNGVIADDPKAFADAAVQLYENEVLWEESQKKGFRILDEKFSEEIHRERFRERLQEVSGNLEQHRNSNFTGLMMQHHSMNSTKFLSKYIEAKNRNRP